MDKYKNYTVEDFLADDYFIQWLNDPEEEHEAFWTEFVAKYPKQRVNVEQAKFIVSMFQHEQEKLSLDETYDIWNDVVRSNKRSKVGRWGKWMRYAAMMVLVFISGAVSFYVYETTREVHYELSEVNDPNQGEAKIVLSDGTEISLEKNESEITYDSFGSQLVVNNDTITQSRKEGKELMNKVIIPYGKKSMIMLSDGTKVWLNAGSQLVYPSVFLRNKREVVLVGEAYFDVTKNQDKPFIVRTAELNVRVLGTKFDVSAYPEDDFVATTLEEGSVGLEIKGKGLLAEDKQILLTPNQKISLNKATRETTVRVVDVSMYTSWKEGILKSESEDLIRLIKKIERYYNIEISLKDPLVAGYKISGKLDLENSAEEVLNIIKLTVPIDWTKKSNGDFIIMSK
ncbi:FecR family protein [Sunxiuqinia elliptica]|uniref:FecR family protein n=1 Tax=Sunxiuqinia elliptica TaxID=655355 RepID=A0A4R6H8A0_9BACT|nr:FecR domain-containing protein [Sunxiuqinia elliptica]TDO04088.1 FecR family protein [Sunxiuqinia elliptica]TDO62370.1 FecR family protein [Sunxiuqinia elliptica]